MARCPICYQSDSKTIPELPNERFCGCNYEVGLAKATNIKVSNLVRSVESKDELLKTILSKISECEGDNVAKIKALIHKELNIQNVKIVDI